MTDSVRERDGGSGSDGREKAYLQYHASWGHWRNKKTGPAPIVIVRALLETTEVLEIISTTCLACAALWDRISHGYLYVNVCLYLWGWRVKPTLNVRNSTFHNLWAMHLISFCRPFNRTCECAVCECAWVRERVRGRCIQTEEPNGPLAGCLLPFVWQPFLMLKGRWDIGMETLSFIRCSHWLQLVRCFSIPCCKRTAIFFVLLTSFLVIYRMFVLNNEIEITGFVVIHRSHSFELIWDLQQFDLSSHFPCNAFIFYNFVNDPWNLDHPFLYFTGNTWENSATELMFTMFHFSV